VRLSRLKGANLRPDCKTSSHAFPGDSPMSLVELHREPRTLRAIARLPFALFILMLLSIVMIADGPIASSSFVGAEAPLYENGAWAPLTSLSPNGSRFQKNNGAFPDLPAGYPNHVGARTTAVVPADHYSEIVVGHVGSTSSNVGPIVRVQSSGASIDSHYLWWASQSNGVNNLYRIDATGTTYTANVILPTSPVVDGDRLRLIARGPVIYGIKNGVRDFIYNTGPDATKYSTGTAGMLAYAGDGVLTNAMIASWSAGTAPVSSAAWASSTFTGIENPLDQGDRWYPLPGYSGFKEVGGLAIGRDANHNASGVWSITPPAKQYSQVTLGTVASGGGGPIVRIDRTNNGQTGWLLFLAPQNVTLSGIYKMNPDGSFTSEQLFAPTITPGDKWRLTADGNTLEVFQNGVSQFTYTTDGSYPVGDVGIEAYTPNFTFSAWEGGNTAAATAPTITSFTPTSGPLGTNVTIDGTGLTGATSVTFNSVSASFVVSSDTAIQATVPAGATTGPLSVTTPGGTATSANNFTVVSAPTITSFTPASGPLGTSVTISGTNFSGTTAVTFNGVSAAFTVNSATAIQATVPAGATTGPLSVTTPGGTATSTNNFTVSATLTVTKAGTGGGTVTSSSNPAAPTQINCGPTCSVSYESGTVVTLTATPATGSNYTAWSGCDSVSGATCAVTMSAGRSVTATFTLQIFTLTVSRANTFGIGNGTVTSTSNPRSSSQINCGPTCSASYGDGTVVTLTATPGFLSTFDSWSGCDAASGMTCTVTVNEARSVTAHFLP
jgi:hypothetical protein